MYKIAQYVSIGRLENGGVFGAGSNQIIIKNKASWESVAKISLLWKKPNTADGVKALARTVFPELDEEIIERAIKTIVENNFLIKPEIFDVDDRYSRNKLYYNFMGANPKKVQESLSRSTVAILGCGGIGNHISYMLTTSGVGKLILIDNDHIEISNLTRQVLFTESDVNKKKVEILKRELLARNNEAKIEVFDMVVRSEDDLAQFSNADLFVLSADHPAELIDRVNSYCVKNKQPYISVGYINDISVIGPFYIPGETGCFRCNDVAPVYFEDDPLKEIIDTLNYGFKPATFSVVNGVAASYATGDIIKFLVDSMEKYFRQIRGWVFILHLQK